MSEDHINELTSSNNCY